MSRPNLPQPNKTIDSGLDAAIIYSGKHVGHWDDNLSKGVKAGTITRLLLDLPALKEALQKTIAQEANKAVVAELEDLIVVVRHVLGFPAVEREIADRIKARLTADKEQVRNE